MGVTCCALVSDSTYERYCEFERKLGCADHCSPYASGTNANCDGRDTRRRRRRLPPSAARLHLGRDSVFAAAAGLEGQKLASPLLAALPGVAAAGALAYRARPALALSPPMTVSTATWKFATLRARVKACSLRDESKRANSSWITWVRDRPLKNLTRRYENLLEARYAGTHGSARPISHLHRCRNPRTSESRAVYQPLLAPCRKVRQRFPDRRLRFFAAAEGSEVAASGDGNSFEFVYGVHPVRELVAHRCQRSRTDLRRRRPGSTHGETAARGS